MPKLTKRANRDGRPDANYIKASLLKTIDEMGAGARGGVALNVSIKGF